MKILSFFKNLTDRQFHVLAGIVSFTLLSLIILDFYNNPDLIKITGKVVSLKQIENKENDSDNDYHLKLDTYPKTLGIRYSFYSHGVDDIKPGDKINVQYYDRDEPNASGIAAGVVTIDTKDDIPYVQDDFTYFICAPLLACIIGFYLLHFFLGNKDEETLAQAAFR